VAAPVPGLVALGLLVLGSLALTGAVHGQQSDPLSLDDCDQRVGAAPEDYRSYRCYVEVARRSELWSEASRRLVAILAREPANHFARGYLAQIEADQGHDRAEELYRAAADGYASVGNRTAEAYLLLGFSYFLSERRSRIDDAEAELDRAHEAAVAAGDPVLLAWIKTRRAMLATGRQDYGRAWLLLREVESDVFPEGPADLRRVWLSYMGHTSWGLGRFEAAMRFYRREAELARSLDQTWDEAVPRRNMTLMAAELGLERELRLKLAREALAVAREGGNTGMEGSARYDLAFLTDGAEQLEHATRALAIARARKEPGSIRMALRTLALALIDTDPARSFQSVEEAIELSTRYGNLGETARNLAFRANLRRRTGPRELATAESLAALDAIEATRNLQPDVTVRARNFGTWSGDYYDLSAYLLGAALGDREDEEVGDKDLELAFRVMERMRARSLLDELDAARATGELAPGGPLAEERQEVLEEIARVQRRLLDPSLPEPERVEAAQELDRLELAEAGLRDRLARADPAFAALRQPVLATLEEISSVLTDHQALLAFQLAPPRRRGETRSWLFVVSRAGARVYPLPPRTRIGPAVQMLLGLFGRRDEAEQPGTARLYDELVRAALDDLPAGIERLIIVPDGILYLLPFGSLRPEPWKEPLAARFDITVVPSATIWLRLSTGGAVEPDRSALVLADPVLEHASASDATRATPLRAPALGQATALGPLPHARREGRLLARHLGGRAELLIGEQATEQSLEELELARFGVLHFAAHALVNHEEPHRSAIVLAPGARDQDGLLQIREIVELDLSDQLVVLSACRSATGPVLSGEGIMGLARAFFVAGARSVVGSLWPLRDDEAAVLFGRFYRHLADGRSVAAALAAARREQMEAGAPAHAWAGVVVLGDGDLVPFPSDVGRHRTALWIGILAGLTLAGAAWAWKLAFRR
jgi:CHAT domain-containing protein